MAAGRRLSNFMNFDFLEEKHTGNASVDDKRKVERPRRLSRLFCFPVSKVDVKEPVFQDEAIHSDKGNELRQISRVSSFTKEEEISLDNGNLVFAHKERKEIRQKPTCRFSSLFAGPYADPSDDDSSLSGEGEVKPQQPSTKDDITTMVLKLFHIRSPRQNSRQKCNTSTRTAASFKPRQPDSKLRKAKKENKERDVRITLYFKPFWKQTRNSLATKSTKDVDALSLTPTVVKKSRKSKRERATSVCDSKFSSMSSALSFTSSPHELISITASQASILSHLLQKVTRSLQNQQRLTATFSTNLAHLFARKERTIDGNKRLSREGRKMLLAILNRLRELVGKTFLKKAVLLQRSLQVTSDLEEMLVRATREAGDLETNESETTVVSATTAVDANGMCVTIEELNTSPLSLPASEPQVEKQSTLDIQTFQHTLHILREDIEVQKQLDTALRAGIVGPCEDVRFPASVNERVAMRRVVAFVDGCLSHLGGRYAQEGKVLKVLDVLGGVLKDGGV